MIKPKCSLPINKLEKKLKNLNLTSFVIFICLKKYFHAVNFYYV